MTYLISLLFIIEFLLIFNIFFITLFRKGFTFKGGIAFGTLYFIFIPIFILIITGEIYVFKADFGKLDLVDVILQKNIKTSFILISYLFAIILYLYSATLSLRKAPVKFDLSLNLKKIILIYLITLGIIFIGSGLLKGGNWYSNRSTFLKEGGSLAVLVVYIYNAAKILIIADIIYYWNEGKLKFIRFLAIIFSFTIFDMIVSGNRIYLFVTATIVILFLVKKHPLKSLILTPVLLPVIFFFGYFASIFRHIRGPLFAHGLPTFEVFVSSMQRAIDLDPPKLNSFFLNISESINVNVIYNIFDNYEGTLYGATYLKTLVFYIPRSIWENKPESITVITANYYGSSSLVTTIIGEMHMNFNYFGIIILPILLIFTESIITRFSKDDVIFGIIAFFLGVLIFRMPYSDELLVFFFLVLIIYFSNKKIKFVIRK